MTTNRYEISFWSKRHILKLAQGNGYKIIETVSRNDTKQNPLPESLFTNTIIVSILDCTFSHQFRYLDLEADNIS